MYISRTDVLTLLQKSSADCDSKPDTNEQASTRTHYSSCTVDDSEMSNDDDDERADIIDEKKATARIALEQQCDEMLKILTSANLLLPRRDIKVMQCGSMINHMLVYAY
jgi:hypothetical protein